MKTLAKQRTAWTAIVGGSRLVFRRQRVLWWLFVVNLGLGLIAVLPVRLAVGDVLDHSLASSALTDHFDLAAYAEVASSPEFNFSTLSAFSMLTAVVFSIIVFFAESGVIQEFLLAAGVHALPRKQTSAEFFGACGLFWGRMVRLLLWSLLPLGVLCLFRLVLTKASDLIADRSPGDEVVMQVSIVCGLLFLLLLAAVRVWISIAEIHIVASGQRFSSRAFFRDSLKLVVENFRTLYAIQLVVAVLGLMVTLLGLAVWIRFVPATNAGMAFLISELTLLAALGCRLWRTAALVIWYERHWAESESNTVQRSGSRLEHSPILVLALD